VWFYPIRAPPKTFPGREEFKTVQHHVSNIFGKLRVADRAQAN
jgi:hypothetical protein